MIQRSPGSRWEPPPDPSPPNLADWSPERQRPASRTGPYGDDG